MMKALVRRRFQVLLLAMLLLVVVYPVAHDFFGEWVFSDVLLALVFLAGFLVIFSQKSFRALGLILGVPTFALGCLARLVPGPAEPSLAISLHLLAPLFLGFTAAVILREISKEKEVSADSVHGAFCGYLLVAVAFAHLYCAVEVLLPGSFRGSPEYPARLREEGRFFKFVYFSLMTITTVGYGDITPRGGAARALASVEAVVGQFYVAVLIAELIGKRVAQAVSGPPPDRR
jgi:hypothetical protein